MMHSLQNFPRLLFFYTQGEIYKDITVSIVQDTLSIFGKSQVLTHMSPYHLQNTLQHSLIKHLLSSALLRRSEVNGHLLLKDYINIRGKSFQYLKSLAKKNSSPR